MPLIQMFDKQINVRMGQANVKRWMDDLLPLLVVDEADPLGVEDFATHRVPLDEAPQPTRPSRKSKTAPSRSSYNRDGPMEATRSPAAVLER